MTWRNGWGAILTAKSSPASQGISCQRIRALADRGVNFPAMIDVAEIQELCSAIVNHHAIPPNPLFCSDTRFLPKEEG